MRRVSDILHGWVAKWLIRYLSRKKLSDIAAKNQQIADLQRELNALKLARVTNPGMPDMSFASQLIAQTQPPVPLGPLAPIQPPAAPPPAPVPEEPAVASMPASATTLPEVPPEPLTPDVEPIMSNEPASQEVVQAAAPAPAAPRTVLPDVKMLAPLLKIALATLSIEQMVEIGLHVKMGAPGFKEFLDSDVAKTEFRKLYATYCDFLAGKVK